VKFFLHVSKDEQKRRFLARLDNPDKQWKFSAADVAERAHWDRYMAAYDQAITATSRPWAPWHVIPAEPQVAHPGARRRRPGRLDPFARPALA
jgi:polyphosphate kinase 2 (PPK2 family)